MKACFGRNSMHCKVRFAPSPTGLMHLGNARIAVVNYLFCKKNNGKFLLRIDDTDIVRSQKKYEEAIYEDLNWFGINYDEKFKQSERILRYQETMQKLIENGDVYRCYETQEELEYKRRLLISKGRPPVYDRFALSLSDTERRKLESDGIPHYWRFKLPNKTISWNDLILGKISYNLNNVSDPVIAKADGVFLYTFSSVIDDIDSKISHIIRGQDHVTNTAVQIALFDAISGQSNYGIDFAHVSLLVNEDGEQFSKRFGSMNIGNIRDAGIDSMTILNFLATIGSSLDISTFLKMEDLAEYFDISKFSSNSPRFCMNDIIKLNRKIIHSRQYDEVKDFGISEKIFEVIKDNITSYKDFALWNDILSANFIASYSPDDLGKKILNVAIEELKKINVPLDEGAVKNLINNIECRTAITGKNLYFPIRKSITGMENGPNLGKLFALLGKDEILRRLHASIKVK
jgi:glutamyl-tRNA synthetase